MVTKQQIKLIKSLAQKKHRQQLNLFTVEGIKGINEFLNSDFILENLFTTDLIFEADAARTIQISNTELKKISTLKTPNKALALFKIPKQSKSNLNGLTVVLDNVRDPGNLGTIIRLCDWYGVENLICSNNTVDCYNPKVVQATMGSLTRVNIVYKDLENFLETASSVYGTFMDGNNIYTSDLPKQALIVLGNEANGISKTIEDKIEQRLTIPRFGKNQSTESLNVANATAIVLSEFRRRFIEM